MPHEIWALPFTYYVAIRDDYIDIMIPPEKREEIEGNLSLTRLDELADKGISDIDFDAVLRKQRQGRKAVGHG